MHSPSICVCTGLLHGIKRSSRDFLDRATCTNMWRCDPRQWRSHLERSCDEGRSLSDSLLSGLSTCHSSAG